MESIEKLAEEKYAYLTAEQTKTAGNVMYNMVVNDLRKAFIAGFNHRNSEVNRLLEAVDLLRTILEEEWLGENQIAKRAQSIIDKNRINDIQTTC